MKKIKQLLLLALPFLMIACSKDSISGTEDQQIDSFVSSNKLTVTEKTASGLRYCLTTPGTGAALKAGQTVTVKYNGKFMTGKSFDSGNFPFVLGAGGVVKGFDEGIAKMKIGEKATIVFPSALGYGTRGQGSIPGGSPLAFEIEVLSAK